MRTSLNTFHRNNIHRTLLLSCALTVLSGTTYADDNIKLFVDTGVSATISGILSNQSIAIATGYTKQGAGTLVLTPSSANTYTGLTFVSGGILELGNNNAILSSLQLNAGTTLRAGGAITLTEDNNIILSGSATFDAQSYAFIFNGLINASIYDLTLKGAGPITFTSGNALATLHVGDGVSTTTLILSGPNSIKSAPILAKTGTTLRFGAGTYSMTIASF